MRACVRACVRKQLCYIFLFLAYSYVMIFSCGAEEDEEWPANDYGSSSHDVVFEGGFALPEALYARLFDYQKTAVKWLWELHRQESGGIVGDEMGLGKTIQAVAFLAGLHHSKLLARPTLVVCPATVLRQWAREVRTWWSPFRTVLLHSSASQVLDELRLLTAGDVTGDCVVITTYEALRGHQAQLLPLQWAYAVLDEGHKIRNPDADITLTCKRLNTAHRLILTGAPIQNNLKELWSLFDFVFPGRLGVCTSASLCAFA